MKVEVPDHVLQTILNEIDEGDRLKRLSNEDLVRDASSSVSVMTNFMSMK